MSDDKKVSELISQSMRQRLSAEEEKQIEDSVDQSEESRKFAALSKQINESMSGLKPADEAESKTPLPDDVRARLSDTVSWAVQEKLSMSQTELITDSASISDPDHFEYDPTKSQDDYKEIVIRFQRIRKLATGGLGEVWIARDEKLGRSVVIKELNSVAKESSQAWGRFQREAEITGLLEHPNIVPLYISGIDRRTSEPFYAMRFVGQRNLSNAIEEHHDRVEAGQADGLSLHRLLNVFLDICQAIAYAHSRGVIHRDLKPENIAIDNFGQVVVLDWGLAKIMEESELALKLDQNCQLTDSSLMRTTHGEIIGTPVYMAPEQASGQIELIDTRTDVYGLGGILFSILTGKAPHAGVANESNSGFREIITQIAEASTPMPSDFANIASELDAICVRALSRKRHLRFDSASELAEAVEQWMVGQSSKKIGYEKLRMEGRELRADLQAQVHDLERNVSFCSGLPPVQELIKAKTEDDEKVWRKRMSTILVGLMEANPGYQSLVYGRFEGDSYTELVRVEKQSGPIGAIRTIPQSRLETRKLDGYLTKMSERLPSEPLTSLVCQDDSIKTCKEVGLKSGIPIYDLETEEVFGFIVASRDINQFLAQQLSRRHTAGEIVVASDTFNIMSHKLGGQQNEETRGQTVASKTPVFNSAVEHLQSNLDFVDEAKSEIYGARIWFDPDKNGLMFLLRR